MRLKQRTFGSNSRFRNFATAAVIVAGLNLTAGNTVPYLDIPKVCSQTNQTTGVKFVANDVSDVKNFLKNMGIEDPSITPLDTGKEMKLVSSALSSTYAGPLISDPPPYAVKVSPEVLYRITRDKSADGMHIPNSNIILISASSAESPEERSEALTHEITHYAAWRGRGFSMIYSTEGKHIPSLGKDVKIIDRSVNWFNEGVTNSISSSLVKRPDAPLDYRYETMVAVLLERVVGQDMLRQAYVSGDYRCIQQIVNSKLGPGTFEELLKIRKPKEAFEFLWKELRNNGHSFEGIWLEPRGARYLLSRGRRDPESEKEIAQLVKIQKAIDEGCKSGKINDESKNTDGHGGQGGNYNDLCKRRGEAGHSERYGSGY